MTTEIKITADERLLAALSAIAGALCGATAKAFAAALCDAPAAAAPAKESSAEITGEAVAPAPVETPALSEAEETALRAEIKRLGIAAVRGKKTDAVRKLLSARGLTELREIPAGDLAAFKAEMEACLA